MLKYLFTAIYEDGTEFKQTQDDISSSNLQKSAFYDIYHERLLAFGIEGDNNAILVDLRDGSFQINGTSFEVYDRDVKDRRLVFFRRHTHKFNIELDELDHAIQYCIGWQGNDPETGANVQRVLMFT